MLRPRGQDIAFALLARRDYSREEMARKLATRGVSREEIEGILQYLEDHKYLDDRRYAQRWASSWIQGKLLGPLKIRGKLLQKGISEAVVKETLVHAEEILPAKERLRKILTAQWKKEKDIPLTPNRRKKLVNLLRQKGYAWEDISEVLQESGGFVEE
jgi:regulatory protein